MPTGSKAGLKQSQQKQHDMHGQMGPAIWTLKSFTHGSSQPLLTVMLAQLSWVTLSWVPLT